MVSLFSSTADKSPSSAALRNCWKIRFVGGNGFRVLRFRYRVPCARSEDGHVGELSHHESEGVANARGGTVPLSVPRLCVTCRAAALSSATAPLSARGSPRPPPPVGASLNPRVSGSPESLGSYPTGWCWCKLVPLTLSLGERGAGVVFVTQRTVKAASTPAAASVVTEL